MIRNPPNPKKLKNPGPGFNGLFQNPCPSLGKSFSQHGKTRTDLVPPFPQPEW